MEITSNWNDHVPGYTAKQAADGAKGSKARGTEKTDTPRAEKTDTKSEYLKKLQKQVPAMELKMGDGFASANGRITHCITISPQLLERMMNDPEAEKEQLQHLKDIERASKYVRSYYNSQGGEIVKHNDQWYIDGKGGHSHYGEIRIDNKANRKLYEEAKEKEKKRIEKSREKAREKTRQKKKEFAEKLEEKRAEKADEEKDGAKKAAEEDAAKEEKSADDTLKAGANIDVHA